MTGPGKLHSAGRNACRGVALFLGLFTLFNLLASFTRSGFDANLWWIDLRWLPAGLASSFLAVSAIGLLIFALRPPKAGWARIFVTTCTVLLLLAALMNMAEFYLLIARHNVHAGLPIPLSLLVAGVLAGIIASLAVRASGTTEPRTDLIQTLVVALACVFLFPLAQMFCFGKTNYQRRADVAVVLGARAYADGRPSDALADRVRTACQLYREGAVSKLLFSGGPGDGAIHETEAMKRMAAQLGVRPADILLDKEGLNTRATARNTELICSQLHLSRILVVSHFYHLPRIKLTYQREGCEVYTVPARESYLLRQMPFNMAREIAAFWVYYLRIST